jgi:hypothetical protein
MYDILLSVQELVHRQLDGSNVFHGVSAPIPNTCDEKSRSHHVLPSFGPPGFNSLMLLCKHDTATLQQGLASHCSM